MVVIVIIMNEPCFGLMTAETFSPTFEWPPADEEDYH